MRPAPKDGSEDKRTAGQIMAEAFAGGGAVRLPRGFGGKDPHRTPMFLRYQACLRTVLAGVRRAKAGAAKKNVILLTGTVAS